jgi:hypothetical protein
MQPSKHNHDLAMHYCQHHKHEMTEAEQHALILVASSWATSENWATRSDFDTLRNVDQRLRATCLHR